MADPMPLNQALETLRVIVQQQKALVDLGAVLEPAAELEARTVALSQRHEQLTAENLQLAARQAGRREQIAAAEQQHRDSLAAQEREQIAAAAENKRQRDEDRQATTRRLRELKAKREEAEATHTARLEELATERQAAEAKTKAVQADLDAIRAKVNA